MFLNIANRNLECENVGLCGNLLHQTTSNAPNAINQKCRIIYVLAVDITILRSLFLLKHKVCARKQRVLLLRGSLFFYTLYKV